MSAGRFCRSDDRTLSLDWVKTRHLATTFNRTAEWRLLTKIHLILRLFPCDTYG